MKHRTQTVYRNSLAPFPLSPCVVFDLFNLAAVVFQAGGQTPKAKPKLPEDGDQRDTMMNMISMASSESTVAGLMSLSVPSSASLLGDKDQGASGSAQTWSGKGVPEQINSEVHTPAKVSLSEYRAKNADVLAAQKRKLENMEASVKRDYANAAQALIGQQQRKEKQQQHHQQPASTYSDLSSPSPIILKIPLEKEKHERSALKMRFPVAGGGVSSGHSARGQDPDIKVRIRMPEKQRGGTGEDSKSRDKHRERSNHHHNHHHHYSSSSSLLSSSHKHSSSSGAATGSSKKVSTDFSRTSSSSSSSSSTSRKRMHSQDPAAPGSHPPSKLSKSSRNPYQLTSLSSSSSGQTLGHASDLLAPQGVPHHQGGYSHGKGEKLDTNGHGGGGSSQSNEYQDTFEMLNSLLSAQGVQPAQPSVFDYRTQYGDYRYSGGARAGNPRPPPLPSEPPPPLPPLPK